MILENARRDRARIDAAFHRDYAVPRFLKHYERVTSDDFQPSLACAGEALRSEGASALPVYAEELT